MAAHAYTMNMPVTTPNKQLSNNSTSASDDDAHEHNTTHDGDDNKSQQDSSHDFHYQSSDMNHEDHSSMNHHDHSSHHSMPMMSQGTVMYMDGFHSALFHNSETPPPCLNFLHPSVRSF